MGDYYNSKKDRFRMGTHKFEGSNHALYRKNFPFKDKWDDVEGGESGLREEEKETQEVNA
jgi:hypothetical protein